MMTRALNTSLIALATLIALLASGCTDTNLSSNHDGPHQVHVVAGFEIDHATGEGILILVNDALTDVPFLDDDCGVDLPAAERIVAHRQGPDGLDGSMDDDLFDDLFELDAVGYVGPSTLQALGEMAHELDLVPVLFVEGVSFTASELDDTLLLVNLAELDALDIDAGLDVRAAEALVNGRPYVDLLEVSERPWVGPATLEMLREYAGPWVDQAGAEQPID